MRAIDLLLSTHRRIRRVRYYRSVRSFFQLQGRCRRVSALIDASETTTQQQKYSGLPGASISDLGNSFISVEACRVGEIYFLAECGSHRRAYEAVRKGDKRIRAKHDTNNFRPSTAWLGYSTYLFRHSQYFNRDRFLTFIFSFLYGHEYHRKAFNIVHCTRANCE